MVSAHESLSLASLSARCCALTFPMAVLGLLGLALEMNDRAGVLMVVVC